MLVEVGPAGTTAERARTEHSTAPILLPEGCPQNGRLSDDYVQLSLLARFRRPSSVGLAAARAARRFVAGVLP